MLEGPPPDAPAVGEGRLSVAAQHVLLASAPVPPFEEHLARARLGPIRAERIRVLQVNLGKLCNQTCRHCHVDAGPHRTRENMDGRTVDACLAAAARITPPTVDLTGGAPELNPHFRRLVRALRDLGVPEVIDRCNLTVLLLPGQADLAEFLAEQRVHVVASLPAPEAGATDRQRGDGVFERSIRALRRLNALGYGIRADLPLTLVSNPSGAYLPPPQAEAERLWKARLAERHGVAFTRLLELANMPIHRFLEFLVATGNAEAYMERLSASFNPAAVGGLMCRDTLSVGWDGTLYDCDFNQMLEMPVATAASRTIFDLEPALLAGRPVRVSKHCLGCTAGQGSSCGGATT